MIQIKRFIDRVSAQEGRGGRDVVLSIADARALRDEIGHLLADRLSEELATPRVDEVVVVGGNWSKDKK